MISGVDHQHINNKTQVSIGKHSRNSRTQEHHNQTPLEKKQTFADELRGCLSVDLTVYARWQLSMQLPSHSDLPSRLGALAAGGILLASEEVVEASALFGA